MRRQFVVLLALPLFFSTDAGAFWLLGFSTADTQAPGTGSFIGGTGGQLTSVSLSSGARPSFTPYLAHAGIRLGILRDVDIGYRLCTVPLPYNLSGPSLGGEVDLKWRLSPVDSAWRLAVGAGMANAYLDFVGINTLAWSPGAFVLVTRTVNDKLDLTAQTRSVYTWARPVSQGAGNSVTALGESVGVKLALSESTSVRPEVGLFRFLGSLGGGSANGWGFQYGAVLSARVW